MIEKVKWLGHASFKITGEKVVYIDPWKLSISDEADIVLVSHPHYDHYSQEDVNKVSGLATVIVTVKELEAKVGGNVRILAPGQKVEVEGVTIEGVSAYNVGKDFHPKANGWLGFVVEMGRERVYYAGDTDKIPEMTDLRNIDVALLPVGGTYTMSAQEALEAAELIKPSVVVPYHWGDIVGDAGDAQTFAAAFSGETVILEAE